MFLLVYYSKVLSSSANELQQNSNAPSDRASDISRKKKQNFAGFSGVNSLKNRPISRDFRGKKVKIRGTIGRFWAIFTGEKSNSQKNWPILQDFSRKKSIFEGFSGANS